MLEFEVADMTCNHCVSAITKAVNAVDPSAQLNIKLEAHRVGINGTASADAIEAAIREAGYSPIRIN